MEIDKLSIQEEKRRREQGSCFNCGQKGHLIRECPNRKNETRVEERPTNAFKGKQQSFQGSKRGGKPTQVRRIASPGPSSQERANKTQMKIREIITEAYGDNHEEDYLRFQEEVEEKGF